MKSFELIILDEYTPVLDWSDTYEYEAESTEDCANMLAESYLADGKSGCLESGFYVAVREVGGEHAVYLVGGYRDFTIGVQGVSMPKKKGFDVYVQTGNLEWLHHRMFESLYSAGREMGTLGEQGVTAKMLRRRDDALMDIVNEGGVK